MRAVEILNSRLYFIRLVEREVIGQVGAELYALNFFLGLERYEPLQRAVAAYHKKRLKCIPALIDAACSRALRQEAAQNNSLNNEAYACAANTLYTSFQPS